MDIKAKVVTTIKKLDEEVEKFENDEAGELSVDKIIALVIGIFVLAAMLPEALSSIFAVDTTTWPASVAAIWDLMPLLIVLAGLVMIVGYTKMRK